MNAVRHTIGIVLVLGAATAAAGAEFRFPMPEFETGHVHPDMHTPPPARNHDALDTALLAGALGAAAWLVLKRRSRRGVLLLAVCCLVYFGFWRKGCVCPVGSLQNVAEAMLDAEAAVSLAVLAFFLLPLVFALFFGRVFCAAVCPLGAIQEMVAVRPVALPRPLDSLLRLIPYAYLGLTILGVATGSGFLICRYDPFVGFFRQGASFSMFMAGGILLLLGLFVGRPYCRFLCPYGVLLGWVSRFSKWNARITPAECIQCRLCEDSCPYGAIDAPTPKDAPLPRRKGVRRLGTALALAPLIVAAGGVTGFLSSGILARLHPTVRLAERVAAEERGEFAEMTLDSEAFRASRQTIPELYGEARAVQADFETKSAWFGAFVGLVIACKLAGLSIVRGRRDYEANREACVSCARCFPYCPVESKNVLIEKQEA